MPGCIGHKTSLEPGGRIFKGTGMGSMTGSRIFAALVLLAAVAAVLSGCGRKAGLDTPYDAQVQARKDAEKAGEPLPPEPAVPETDKPFILDPLL